MMSNYLEKLNYWVLVIIYSVQVTQHMRLLIKASIPAKIDYKPALVGNCKQLGEWDPHQAVVLVKRNDGLYQFQQPLNLSKDQHLQFKIIQLGPNGEVIWEDLPDNKNRKFVVKDEYVLSMSWSSPIGQRKMLRKRRMSSSTAPSLMFYESTKRDATMSLGNFDPFKIAEHSDEEDDDELPKYNITIPATFNYGKKQFEELFYSTNNSVAIAKKLANHAQGRFFLISKEYPSEGSFCHNLLLQLKDMGVRVNWIVENVPKYAPKHHLINFIGLRKKAGGLSEKNLEWLFQRYVQEIIPDWSTVIIVGQIFSHVKINNTSSKGIIFQVLPEVEVIKELFLEVGPIILTSQKKEARRTINKILEEHIQEKCPNRLVQNTFEKSYEVKQNHLVGILYQNLLNSINQTIENQRRTLKPISTLEIQQNILDFDNSIIVVDYKIIVQCMRQLERYYQFLDGLRTLSSTKGRFICIVGDCSREELEEELGFLMVSNIHMYLQHGKEVRLNGRWFYPFEKLDLIVGTIRKKLKKSLDIGELTETENSFTFKCKNQAVLRKLHKDIRAYVHNKSEICYLEIEMGEDHQTLYVAWEYDPINVFETLLRLKCMVQGSVSYSLAIMQNSQNYFIYDSLNTLERSFPSLFKQNYSSAYVSSGKFVDGSHFSLDTEDLKDLTFQARD